MRDDEAGVDLAVLYSIEERTHVAMHVRLARLDRQRAIDDGAHREFVDVAAIDARDGNRSAAAAGKNRLAQRHRPIRLEHHRLLYAIVGALEARRVTFHADGVDAGVRTAATGHLLEGLEHVALLIVDDLGAPALVRDLKTIGES